MITRRKLLKLIGSTAAYAAIPEPLKAMANEADTFKYNVPVLMRGGYGQIEIEIPLSWTSDIELVRELLAQAVRDFFSEQMEKEEAILLKGTSTIKPKGLL